MPEDDRTVNGKELSLTRPPSLGDRLVSTFDPDLYTTEQDCWRESGRERIKQRERGTAPESIFEMFRDCVAENGGALPVVLVNDELVMATEDEDSWPALGLDDDGDMELGELTREELLDLVEENIRDADVDELLDVIQQEAGREWLEDTAAAFLQSE